MLHHLERFPSRSIRYTYEKGKTPVVAERENNRIFFFNPTFYRISIKMSIPNKPRRVPSRVVVTGPE